MRRLLPALALFVVAGAGRVAAGPAGYYRHPAIHGDVVVFVAEGDLWKVPAAGGVATRLTSHPGVEMNPVFSPDGGTVAFTAQYEGPVEVYAMPASGGLPSRLTYDGARCSTEGFTPDGRVVYVTRREAGLPDLQGMIVDPRTGERIRLPLSQVAEAAWSEDGAALFFVRFPFQGSHTRRYRGGMAQDVWRFDPATGGEARNLTADHPGTDRHPMVWSGRVYFASDRDGCMNLWSMTPDGEDLRQHTRHLDWDVKDPALSDGRIAYQLGADLRLLDVASGEDRAIPVTLDGDLDQTRERWVEQPWDWLAAAHLSPDGDRVVLTARGQVFVAPHGPGRLVEVTRDPGVRYRDARFDPGGRSLIALSDESGEVEFWRLPARGVGGREAITRDASVLRWGGVPSPDGKHLAHFDKDQRLHLTSVAGGATRTIDATDFGDFSDLAWSPDSRWLAYVTVAANFQRRIRLYDLEGGGRIDATTDRYESYSPAWSADGKRLYFLSDRHLHSLVRHPWGARQPDPYYDRTTRIYELALVPGLRSPFEPEPETAAEAESAEEKADHGRRGRGRGAAKEEGRKEEAAAGPVRVEVTAEGLAARLHEVPVDPGNYGGLFIASDRLYWLSTPDRHEGKQHLVSAPMTHEDLEVATIVEGVESAEPSGDGKKILVRTGDTLHVLDAGSGGKAELGKKTQVDLGGWAFTLQPREEWRQMFVEAWRLERDYFYDRGMHGVDWPAIRDKYLPLVDRVSDRAELSDVLSQMVSELSALHIYVYGGDFRTGKEDIQPAELGAELVRDAAAGGYRVKRVYASDPDRPALRSPLARPGVDVKAGDVVVAVNGTPALDAPDLSALLRHRAGRQVLLGVRPGGTGEPREVIVEPLTAAEGADRRYHEWEYTRRLETERRGGGRIGYVHLRAMGGDDIDQWTREFPPVFPLEGLIVDVRHNGGGNIDSWILGKLLRKPWFWWQPRVGAPYSNMQLAFGGHMVVLCDERTASDGEAFAEGFRRFGLGTVIGTRTWGGEIWLTSSNELVDRGIATAAEFGVYGPEGEWLIEGHGVDPDVVVDNLPHETFGGRDAQLEAAVDHLLRRLAEEPVRVPPAPPYPDKSFGSNARRK